MSAPRSAAAAFFSVASRSANGCSASVMPGTWYPGRSCGGMAIRIAAAGDIHLGRAEDEERWTAAFAGLRDRVDLVLLAGDLTTHGEPAQAAMAARAAARGRGARR